MRDVRDRLLPKIAEEERRAQKRREEIEDRAIRPHDGRLGMSATKENTGTRRAGHSPVATGTRPRRLIEDHTFRGDMGREIRCGPAKSIRTSFLRPKSGA
jgi:hypothetical protein